MNSLKLLLPLFLILASCKTGQRPFPYENALSQYLESKSVNRQDKLFLLLLGDQCDPCVRSTKEIVARMGQKNTNSKNKIVILCSVCDSKMEKELVFSGLKVWKAEYTELSRHGIASNTNFLIDFDQNGNIENWWPVAIETMPVINSHLSSLN